MNIQRLLIILGLLTGYNLVAMDDAPEINIDQEIEAEKEIHEGVVSTALRNGSYRMRSQFMQQIGGNHGTIVLPTEAPVALDRTSTLSLRKFQSIKNILANNAKSLSLINPVFNLLSVASGKNKVTAYDGTDRKNMAEILDTACETALVYAAMERTLHPVHTDLCDDIEQGVMRIQYAKTTNADQFFNPTPNRVYGARENKPRTVKTTPEKLTKKRKNTQAAASKKKAKKAKPMNDKNQTSITRFLGGDGDHPGVA